MVIQFILYTEDKVGVIQRKIAAVQSVAQPFVGVLEASGAVEAIKSGLNSFMEDIPWLMKSLDEVAKIHPVVTGMLQYSTIESRYSYFRR